MGDVMKENKDSGMENKDSGMENKDNEMKGKEMVISWDEITEVLWDSDSENVLLNKIGVEQIKVPGDKVAKCDLCYIDIGPFKNIESSHIVSPEVMTRAIKKGLLPRGGSLNLAEKYGKEVEKGVIRSWRVMAIASETPWALCSSCFEELEKKLDRGKNRKEKWNKGV